MNRTVRNMKKITKQDLDEELILQHEHKICDLCLANSKKYIYLCTNCMKKIAQKYKLEGGKI
jgi:predicted amidophosphoribosyltransferase